MATGPKFNVTWTGTHSTITFHFSVPFLIVHQRTTSFVKIVTGNQITFVPNNTVSTSMDVIVMGIQIGWRNEIKKNPKECMQKSKKKIKKKSKKKVKKNKKQLTGRFATPPQTQRINRPRPIGRGHCVQRPRPNRENQRLIVVGHSFCCSTVVEE